MTEIKEDKAVEVLYTNWRGETRVRVIAPLCLVWDKTEYHPTPQWLLEAADMEDGHVKYFALKDCDFKLEVVAAPTPAVDAVAALEDVDKRVNAIETLLAQFGGRLLSLEVIGKPLK